MKKSVLALVAVLGLGLVSCDRDERVLEVEKVVEKVVEVEKPGVLVGEWKLVEASDSTGNMKTSSDECIAKSKITFTEDTYTMNLSKSGNGGACTPLEASGKYLYGESLGIIYIKPNDAGKSAGAHSLSIEGNTITIKITDEKKVEYTLKFQK